MKELHQPHDRFFHSVFSQKENARDLLRSALPDRILAKLDLDSIEVSRQSFVDETLSTHQSDILIRAAYRKTPVLIYILVEHKSYPYRWTVLQLLAYMVRIWEKEIAGTKRLKTLCPIIPMIFYHGVRKWALPLDFCSYVELPEELRLYIPDFQPVMFNLRQLDDASLRGGVLFQAALKTFKYALTSLRPHLGDILHRVSALPVDERQKTFLRVLFEYILKVGRDIENSDIEEELRLVGSKQAREAYMTLEEKLLERGRGEGKLEGKREGKLEGKREGKLEGRLEGETLSKQNVLLRLLEKRFGPVSEADKRKVKQCLDRGKLDEAIDLLLKAESADEVLRPFD